MSIRISLPGMSRNSNSKKAHPYPFQIAFQTSEVLQGIIFYIAVVDLAAGEYFKQPGAMDEAKAKMFYQEQFDPTIWEVGWKYIGKYDALFERMVAQNALIAMQSQWDWYIRKLSQFISFGRQFVTCSPMSNKEQKKIERIDRSNIAEQLSLLEKSSDINLSLSEEISNSLLEMSSVRNLGIHNRWEVDQLYKERTKSGDWEIGEIRVFDAVELEGWHEGLIGVINKTCTEIAKKFNQAIFQKTNILKGKLGIVPILFFCFRFLVG